MIIRRLGNMLSIKPNEWDGVFYFFMVLFIFSFGASFARAIGITLLTDNLGGEAIPIAFMLTDLLVMIGSLVYAHYTKKVSGLSILIFFMLSTAVFSVLIQILFITSTGLMEKHSTLRWLYGLFFIGFNFFYILISIHVSSVVASYFTTIQLKRVVSIINTGFPIGGALGGSTLYALLQVFEFKPQNLILVLGITCLGALWFLQIIHTNLIPERIGHSENKNNRSNTIQEFIGAFKYISSSRLMLFMSLGLAAFVICSKLLEYQYQGIIYPHIFKDEVERATFLATYEVFANASWLLIQLFLTSRIVVRFGVGASNLIHPTLSAIAAMALLSYFYLYGKMDSDFHGGMNVMLILAVFTHFINQEMRLALRTPLNNLLFNAIPPNLWGINKAFLNGIIFPISTFVISIFIIVATGIENPFKFIQINFSLAEYTHILFPLIAFIFAILGIVFAIPQWKAYDSGVFGLLNPELFDVHAQVGGKKNKNFYKRVIEEKLNSSDPHHAIAALEMVRVLRLSDFSNQVGNLLLKTKEFNIKTYCISTLSALPQSNANITYLVEALRQEEDPKVIPLILMNIKKFTLVNINDMVEKLLNHPSPAVFVEACLCLYSHPQYPRKKNIENKILVRLDHPKLPEFDRYLYALGELGQARYSSKLLPFLDHHNEKICVTAFQAYIHLLKGNLDSQKVRFLKALHSPFKDVIIAALRALKECQFLEDWTRIIRLLGHKDRIIVNESKELLRLNLHLCKSVLIAQVFNDKVSIQERFEILSLVYPKFTLQQRQFLQEQANKALAEFVHTHGLLKLHQNMKSNSKVHTLITKVLQEIAEDHLMHVLTVITYFSNQNLEFFQRVSRGILSKSKANQGNALEVLTNAGEKYLVDRVLKFFDERANNIMAISRIHLILFEKPLNISQRNYASKLLSLNNDMLKACLYYMQMEKTGHLKISHRSSPIVRKLLTETNEREIKSVTSNVTKLR